jgi:hypothetical protein
MEWILEGTVAAWAFAKGHVWDSVGLLALAVGILALFRAERLYGKLADRLEDLERGQSTKNLGSFPNFIPDIVALMKRTRNELRVLCDFPAYGMFSDWERHKQYKGAIEALGGKVHFMCLNSVARRELHAEQFAGIDWPGDQEFAAKITAMRSWAGPIRDAAEFGNKLLDRDLSLLDTPEWRTFAERMETGESLPIYFWISDGREAIFSFPVASDDGFEFAFHTRDSAIIEALRSIWTRYSKAASPARAAV